MKSLAVVLIGGMMVTGTGCLDAAGDTSEATEASEASEATEASQAEQAGSFEEVVARHCDRNNRLPNNVPVRDESGIFTTMSS
ncbi:MAG TPA: hypothetical protein VHN14_24375, partial [Kofleriaceae bacterium]|nr:hypothetical protein [Kofleriaceae bacterium]